MNIITETPRLTIREFLPEEEAIYLNHFTDELVTRHLPKRSREERIGIYRKALEQYSITNKLGIWGMFNKGDGDFIGSCLLRYFDNDDRSIIELGYSMDRKYWGQGIGTEMAIAMVAYGFTQADVNEVVAVTTLENTGSQRVLENAGLIWVDNVMRNGEELAFFRKSR